MRERALTWDEQIRWGECPVCHVPDGEPCSAEVGLHIGVTVGGDRLKTGEGVHLGRLQRAPARVKEVPV